MRIENWSQTLTMPVSSLSEGDAILINHDPAFVTDVRPVDSIVGTRIAIVFIRMPSFSLRDTELMILRHSATVEVITISNND